MAGRGGWESKGKALRRKRKALRPLSTLTLSCTNIQHRHWARQSM